MLSSTFPCFPPPPSPLSPLQFASRSQATFFPVTNQNSVPVAMTIVLELNSSFPVSASVMEQLHKTAYGAGVCVYACVYMCAECACMHVHACMCVRACVLCIQNEWSINIDNCYHRVPLAYTRQDYPGFVWTTHQSPYCSEQSRQSKVPAVSNITSLPTRSVWY